MRKEAILDNVKTELNVIGSPEGGPDSLVHNREGHTLSNPICRRGSQNRYNRSASSNRAFPGASLQERREEG